MDWHVAFILIGTHCKTWYRHNTPPSNSPSAPCIAQHMRAMHAFGVWRALGRTGLHTRLDGDAHVPLSWLTVIRQTVWLCECGVCISVYPHACLSSLFQTNSLPEDWVGPSLFECVSSLGVRVQHFLAPSAQSSLARCASVRSSITIHNHRCRVAKCVWCRLSFPVGAFPNFGVDG